jgi:hypothetical protein
VKSVARFQNVGILSIFVSHTATVDLSCLVKVEELEIRGLNLTNYHKLQQLKKASFSHCTFSEGESSSSSDVSSLSVSILEMNLDIISALNEVPILKISYCRNLSGWSSLGKNRELCIEPCDRLGDVSHLGNVERLSLRKFIGNLSPLQNVVILDLSHSFNLTDVSCLTESAVKDLNLFWCSKVSDISMLRKVKKLNISFCSRIDLSGLLSLTELVAVAPVVSINMQSAFQTISQLSKLQIGLVSKGCEMILSEALRTSPLKSLYLSEWRTSPTILQLFRDLNSLQSLELHRFRGNLTIPAIPTLEIVKISHGFIPDLFIQGSNQNYPIYYVEILYCEEFTELSVERPISFMKFCSRGVSEAIIQGEENIKDRFFKDVYLKT